MPYDPIGKQYADIIMDPTSIPSRMNAGRLYEAYFGAASRNARRLVLERLGTDVEDAEDSDVIAAFELVVSFLSIIDTEQYTTYKALTAIDDMKIILQEIQDKELYIYYKVSSPKKSPYIVKDMENSIFKVPKEPVIIDGKLTKQGITIGNLYIVLLNKTSDGYLASASASVNHYGIPVRVNASTKTGLPYTNNPTKVESETEIRIYRTYAKSPILAAELKDRASSVVTHSSIYRNILRAEHPSNIDVIVDRAEIPYGHDSSLTLLRDIFNSTGIDFKYVNGMA